MTLRHTGGDTPGIHPVATAAGSPPRSPGPPRCTEGGVRVPVPVPVPPIPSGTAPGFPARPIPSRPVPFQCGGAQPGDPGPVSVLLSRGGGGDFAGTGDTCPGIPHLPPPHKSRWRRRWRHRPIFDGCAPPPLPLRPPRSAAAASRGTGTGTGSGPAPPAGLGRLQDPVPGAVAAAGGRQRAALGAGERWGLARWHREHREEPGGSQRGWDRGFGVPPGIPEHVETPLIPSPGGDAPAGGGPPEFAPPDPLQRRLRPPDAGDEPHGTGGLRGSRGAAGVAEGGSRDAGGSPGCARGLQRC